MWAGVRFLTATLEAAGGRRIFEAKDTAHLMGGCRMGYTPEDSVTNADGRTWDVPNLWICDGSLTPTGGGATPSLTIRALACRTGDRIRDMARSGDLERAATVAVHA